MATFSILRAVLLSAVLSAGACAERGRIDVVPSAAAIGAQQNILVATSRTPAGDGVNFTRTPAPGLSFSQVSVSVPPERTPGTVSFPGAGGPDPRTDFLMVSTTQIADQQAFIRAVNARVAEQPPDEREAFVFVHGFNTNFAEGLYRQAQMRHDFKTPGISVHYSWPSAANVRAYATDRESALLARDDLEALIALLTKTKVSRIVLLGHSMGAFVVMETVRQIAIREGPSGFRKMNVVVLMAPDIDVEVFRRQARDLADDNVSVYVFTSNRDRALRFSAALRRSGERLGSLSDPARISDLPVTIIDLSDVEGQNDAMNHFKVATSYAMISLFRGLGQLGSEMFRDELRNPTIFTTSLDAVQGVYAVALQPVIGR